MEIFCKVLLVYFTINEGKKASSKYHFLGLFKNIFRKYDQNFFSLCKVHCWIVHNKIKYIYYESK